MAAAIVSGSSGCSGSGERGCHFKVGVVKKFDQFVGLSTEVGVWGRVTSDVCARSNGLLQILVEFHAAQNVENGLGLAGYICMFYDT